MRLLSLCHCTQLANRRQQYCRRLRDASMKAHEFGSDRPFCPVADGAHSHRKRPHGPAELAVRPPERAACSFSVSTTPISNARRPNTPLRSSRISRGSESSPISSGASRSGWPSTTTRPRNSRRSGRLYPAYETAEELDRRRKRQQALGRPPVYDRAALRLTGDDRAALEAAGRKPHWRFRLDPGDRALDRHGARREPHRLRLALRPGPAPRGRELPLHAALGGRRHRARSHPCDSRRGSRHQHGRADPAVRGARRKGSRVRPPQPPDRRGRRRAVQADRRPVDRLPAREGGRGRSRSRRSRCWSARPRRCVRSARSTNSPASSISAICPTAPRASTRPSSTRSRRARCTPRLTPRSRDRLAALGVEGPGAEAFWLAVRGNVARLADAAEWRQVVEGDIAPVVEDPAYLVLAARRFARRRLGPDDLGPMDEGAQGGDRPQGQGPLSSAAARADGARVRAGARGAASADRPR